MLYRHHVFVAAEAGGLTVVDVADPAAPVKTAGKYRPVSLVQYVVVDGNVVYVTGNIDNQVGSVFTLSTSASGQLQRLGLVDLYQPFGLDVVGNKAYVANGGMGISMLDVSDPSQLKYLGTEQYLYENGPVNVLVYANQMYVADNHYGFMVLPVPPVRLAPHGAQQRRL